ncbi:UAA transporter [Borealophlyctis nickersoniae]|nr:UAA transporter [Borealophlyctis nickersoniae]
MSYDAAGKLLRKILHPQAESHTHPPSLVHQIIFGVALTTKGDYSYTSLGFYLTVVGALLAATKTVVTNRVQVGRLKLHPLDLLLRMSPLALAQSVAIGYKNGEWDRLVAYWESEKSKGIVMALFFNGLIAFGLNIVSFTANKKTSALTMTVAANVKQVLSIVLAIVIFQLHISAVNALGILITLGGGAWYTYVEYQEKQSPTIPLSLSAEERGRVGGDLEVAEPLVVVEKGA